jgi:hypothetical protein
MAQDEPESGSGEVDTGLAWRLLVAGILSALLAVVCWVLLPRAGVDLPWFVPVLAFAVILAGALARAQEPSIDEVGDNGDVAGRIGPRGGE